MAADHFTPSIKDIDALPLEYKLQNWCPRRQVDISHFIGDTALDRFLGLRGLETHLVKAGLSEFHPPICRQVFRIAV